MSILQSLDPNYYLRKHNMEAYITEKMHEQLYWTDLFDLVDNQTGEFTNIIADASAEKDLQDGIMYDPAPHSEGADFPEVETGGISRVRGTLAEFGAALKYTNMMINRGTLTQELTWQMGRLVSLMCNFYNRNVPVTVFNVANYFTESNSPELSHWMKNDDTNDPIKDVINLNKTLQNDGWGFEITDVFLNIEEYEELLEYTAAFKVFNDGPNRVGRQDVTFDKITLGGITFHSWGNAVTQGKYMAIDRKAKPVVIEKYVDKMYSTVKQAELTVLDKAKKGQKNLPNVPKSLINIHKLEGKYTKRPDVHKVMVWCQMNANIREPHAIMTGKFEDIES